MRLAQPAQAQRTAPMGYDEGTPAATRCPNKTFLAGFAVQYDSSMSGLAPYCVAMTDDGMWSGGARIHLDALMSKASVGGTRLDLFCPRGFFLVGYRGYTHVYGIHSIMQITITCRNVRTGTLYEIATEKGTQALTEWPDSRCADNAVGDGTFGRVDAAGTLLQFGLSCALTLPAARERRNNAVLRNGARESAAGRLSPAPLTQARAWADTGALPGAASAPPLGATSARASASASALSPLRPLPKAPLAPPDGKRYEAPSAFGGTGSR
jgi:hypothetical protein